MHLHSLTHTHLGWGRLNRRPPRSFQVRFGCASPHVVQRALASARVRESAPPRPGFGGGGGGVYASHHPLDTEPRVCGSRPVATSCALVHGPMSPHGVPAFIAPVAGCVTPPMHDVSVGVVIAPSPTDKCLVLAGRGATSRCAQGAAGPSGARTYTRDVRERRPVTRASRPHHRVRSPVRRREAAAGLDRQL